MTDVIQFPNRPGGARKLTLIERAALRTIERRQLEELAAAVAAMKELAGQLGPDTSPALTAAIKHSIAVLAAGVQFTTRTLIAARKALRENVHPGDLQEPTPPTEPAA